MKTQNEILESVSEFLRVGGTTAQNFQFYERLFTLALTGMNVGGSSDAEKNGEMAVVGFASTKITNAERFVVFDVGANSGDYSRSVLAKFPNALIHAFEPNLTSFNQLKVNLVNSGVILHNFGLSSKPGTLSFYENSPGSELASVYQRRLDHFGIVMKPAASVEVRTLDDTFSSLGLERIHLLKLDVEGHEIDILRGAEKTLSSNRVNMIQFEFGGSNIDSKTFFQDVWYSLPTYTFFRIFPDGLVRIRKYSELLEIFTYQNFLAVRNDLV